MATIIMSMSLATPIVIRVMVSLVMLVAEQVHQVLVLSTVMPITLITQALMPTSVHIPKLIFSIRSTPSPIPMGMGIVIRVMAMHSREPIPQDRC